MYNNVHFNTFHNSVHTLAGHVTADYSQLRATRLQGPLFDLGSEPGWLPEALGLQSEEGESEHPGSAQLRHYLERQGVTTGRQFVAQFEDKHQSFREAPHGKLHRCGASHGASQELKRYYIGTSLRMGSSTGVEPPVEK